MFIVTMRLFFIVVGATAFTAPFADSVGHSWGKRGPTETGNLKLDSWHNSIKDVFERNSHEHRRLPDSVPSPSGQCIKKGYFAACLDEACFPHPCPDICKHLKCGEKISARLYSTDVGPAMNGTLCGKSSVCDNGECVQINRAYIPVNTLHRSTLYCKFENPKSHPMVKMV